MRMSAVGFSVALVFSMTLPAVAQMNGMNMPMPDKPAHFAATRQAYTTNHAFLVKLISVPNPIPYEKYFRLRLAVYDAGAPAQPIPNPKIAVVAGMRHGMKSGFMHGMESAPKVTVRDGIVTVSGMYFHMMGPWTLQTDVSSRGKRGIAYFDLPCCAQ